ncbi:hypothetical protein AGR4B_pAt20436 [Agrobacterium tumefaciens str. CFBP 5621]|jgi:hypothetical protein|nr:hypothetical protein AGR4B_pAt20436 [Agrobacterium tumefaciens str. CFBP 5621]
MTPRCALIRPARIFLFSLLNNRIWKPNRYAPVAESWTGRMEALSYGASMPMLLQGEYGYDDLF